MRWKILAFMLPTFVVGCTGFSPDNQAGADTFLESGDVAVDDRTWKSFVLTTTKDADGVEKSSVLHAVPPKQGEASEMAADLTGRSDARISFPESGVLVMSEKDGKDQLLLLDSVTLAEKGQLDADVRYHGTRMSPSRKWVAVADNTSTNGPIHIIDAEMLTHRVIPHDGYWLEAMWMNNSDELFAIVFHEADAKVPDSKPYASILSWSMADILAMPDSWPEPRVNVTIENVEGDLLFSYTWVGISPDDKWAVFPVREVDASTPETYELVVVDTATGDWRTVPDVKGPVGFTPDSSTIVTYDDNGTGAAESGELDQRLVLVNVDTLEKDPQDVDISGGISYFVSRDGNFVVVASNYGDQAIVLYDIDNHKSTKMAGLATGLQEFVFRDGTNELWLLDVTNDTSLYKLDMNAASLLEVELGYAASHLNILSPYNLLVLGERGDATTSSPRLHFFDLAGQTEAWSVDLPSPE